jgi:dTDP-4-amino-4,6-dideoxygalactose transaminase
VRQPPAYSPLPWQAVCASAGAVLRRETNDRASLREVLRREFGAEGVALFASGTQALQVALADARRAAGSNPTVALPAFTCFDVATAAVGAGLRIALYDVDPETLTPDLDSLSGALDEGARIVVVAPLFGFPVDWEAVCATAAKNDASVIEDSAQGSGATWHGARLGSLGETSVLSFGRGKGWTGGCGGALLTRRRGATQAVHNGRSLGAELRVLTLASAQWAFGRPALYGLPAALPWLGLGETRYRDPTPPRPLPRTAARLLLHDVAASRREAEERRRRAERLLAAIAPSARSCTIRALPGGVPGYLRLPLRVMGGLAGLAQPDVARRLGAARSYPHGLGALPAVRERLVDSRRTWPGAEALARELITLPTHSLLSRQDLEQLARAVGG